MTQSKLARQWEAARDDLGIDIVVPYCVRLANGKEVLAVALVKHFGYGKGMLIFADADAVWPYRTELLDSGYGYSVLEEPTTKADEHYDRESFVDILSDWEWTGAVDDKPDWLKPPPT